MTFTSAMDMFNYLNTKGDLYNKWLGFYVFALNHSGALCYFNLTPDEVEFVAQKSQDNDEEFWDAFLNGSGTILDDCEYYRYEWEDTLDVGYRNYIKPSLDFCHNYYHVQGWVDTNEVKI